MKRHAGVVVASLFLCAGCGGTAPGPRPAASEASDTTQPADIASSDPQLRYFHEQLVNNGEDIQSGFGSDLLTLGMNPRDLQQDDPKHAYDTVLEKVRAVSDPALKREMMRTF